MRKIWGVEAFGIGIEEFDVCVCVCCEEEERKRDEKEVLMGPVPARACLRYPSHVTDVMPRAPPLAPFSVFWQAAQPLWPPPSLHTDSRD